MKKYLIVNADDFGYSRGTNYGILDSFQQGILTSATIMANGSAFDQAVEIAQENPGLGVGVHLNLTFGQPLGLNYRKIVDSNGRFPKLSPMQTNQLIVDKQETEQELRLQIEKVFATGIKPTHLDSHHHFHKEPMACEIVWKLAEEYHLPLRWGYDNLDSLRKIRHVNNLLLNFDLALMEGMSDAENWSAFLHQFIEKLVRKIAMGNGSFTEVMCHPAYLDQYLYEHTSMDRVRAYEVVALCYKELPKMLKKHEIELVNYHALRNVPA